MSDRREALTALLDDLAAFEFKLNDYYDDPEPQSVIDNLLTGQLDSLLAFCEALGWSNLVTSIQGMTPLQGNAVESLRVVQSFVVPEARRLLAATNIDAVTSSTDWVWQFIHPGVAALARPRFESGLFW